MIKEHERQFTSFKDTQFQPGPDILFPTLDDPEVGRRIKLWKEFKWNKITSLFTQVTLFSKVKYKFSSFLI